MRDRFTEEELVLAKSVDLVAVASALGYTPKRIGRYYTLKEMDSIRIYDRSHWFRWSRRYDKGENGGSQIDFLRVFAGMDIKEAVFWLLDFAGYGRREIPEYQIRQYREKEQEVKKEFALPERAKTNDYLYRYLQNDRALSKEVIDYFVEQCLIYESEPYHNIVFLGNDAGGETRFASMRGVFDRNGKVFKCDVAGNDKRYGFNVTNAGSEELIVFEAAIDLMSYVEIYGDYETNKLALGMLHDAPLETFLQEHPNITQIRFCLDNDAPGREATENLREKYYGLGYDVEDAPPPKGYKDYNEWLVKSGKIPRDEKCYEKVL